MRGEQSKDNTDSFMKVAIDVMFMQMSAKAGINKFGDKAAVAMVKYYRQIYKGTMEGNSVVTFIDTDTLSYEDKRKSLQMVNLIKQKRNGIIKGRTCADGGLKS